MLDDWIGNLESKTNNGPTYNQRLFLAGIKNHGEYVGQIKIQSESNCIDRLFCYMPDRHQGWVLDKDEKGLGAVVSYGGLSKEDFTNKYYPFAAKEAKQRKEATKKKVRNYSLISFSVAILPAVYLGIKKFLEHRKKE